jgi:dienelactone hydrolase
MSSTKLIAATISPPVANGRAPKWSPPPSRSARHVPRRRGRYGKPHEFHIYDHADHAFFAVDRPSYRVEAANDGSERIEAFFAKHLD